MVQQSPHGEPKRTNDMVTQVGGCDLRNRLVPRRGFQECVYRNCLTRLNQVKRHRGGYNGGNSDHDLHTAN